MRSIFSLALIGSLVACGSDGGGPVVDGNPTKDGTPAQGLTCSAVTFCTTYDALQVTLPAPAQTGGVIPDGTYRLERGTFSAQVLVFAGNQFLDLDNSFANRLGTYQTSNGNISFTYNARCDAKGAAPNTNTWLDRPYFISGDTLTIAIADTFSNGVKTFVWYEYKRIATNAICTENEAFKCTVTTCSCAVVTNGFGTVTGGTKVCAGR